MIYTSYYAKYCGYNGVSISNGTPKGVNIQRYKPLIPDWDMVQNYKSGAITWKDFRREYIKQLKQLSALNVYNELNGKVLLCYEKEGKCHRHIIEEWFRRNNLPCGELETSNECNTCHDCRRGFLACRGGVVSWVCKMTGEMMTVEDSMLRDCGDWRYFA